jgi:hypothetical protein
MLQRRLMRTMLFIQSMQTTPKKQITLLVQTTLQKLLMQIMLLMPITQIMLKKQIMLQMLI